MGDHDKTARGIIGPLALVTPMSVPVMREVIETVTEALDAAALAERKRIIALLRERRQRLFTGTNPADWETGVKVAHEMELLARLADELEAQS